MPSLTLLLITSPMRLNLSQVISTKTQGRNLTLSDGGVESILQLKALAHLDIRTALVTVDQTNISRRGLLLLCNGLSSLVSLTISNTVFFSGENTYGDEGIYIIVRQAPLLERLSARACQLSFESVEAISVNLTRLNTLTLTENMCINGRYPGFRRLRHIKVVNTNLFNPFMVLSEYFHPRT